MPVRLRITFWFTAITILLLMIVCGTVYYISYLNREASIRSRLVNRAITTARLLRSASFDRQSVRRIDSLTASVLKHKTVQAYDATDRRIYFFSDSYADTINASTNTLVAARKNRITYFRSGEQDVITYHFEENGTVIISAAYDEQGEKNLSDLVTVLMVSSIIGILIAIVSGYLFSARLLSPVARIARQVDEISAQSLTTRIPTGAVKDEWYHLTNTLNNLLNRLQDSFETQRRFVSNASHELSTPLTSISSQLQVYLQKERDIDQYKKVMESVYQDVQHLNKLTRALLELAKASPDAGGLELNKIRIDEVLLRLPSELQKMNMSYSVSLLFDGLPDDEDELFVFGNAELLFTAFRNIAVNGCKFSEDSHVQISLTASNGTITVAIIDKGPGIEEVEMIKIFEPFFRSANVKSSEGFGLGLSLSQKIIKMHKGDIAVNSQVGKGTAFIVTLPSFK